MEDRAHNLFMGDGHPEDAESWDYNLTTGEVIARVARQIADGEHDGDVLNVVVSTHALKD